MYKQQQGSPPTIATNTLIENISHRLSAILLLFIGFSSIGRVLRIHMPAVCKIYTYTVPQRLGANKNNNNYIAHFDYIPCYTNQTRCLRSYGTEVYTSIRFKFDSFTSFFLYILNLRFSYNVRMLVITKFTLKKNRAGTMNLATQFRLE